MSKDEALGGVEFCPIRGYPIASDGVAAGFGIAGVAYAVGMVGWGLKTGALTAGAVALMCGGAVTGVAIVGVLAYAISRES